MKRATLLFCLILATACNTQKRVKLKELYEKIHAEINGDNAPIDTISKPTLELTKKDQKKEVEREKKIGKKVFYGIKTRRAFTRKGKDPKKREYEIFFVLKNYQEPSPFIKDVYWYHKKKRVVIIGRIEEDDKPYARILHGPYLRRVGKNLMEEGIFYVGSKHGRWVKYDRNYILTDKRRFYKGFPTDAQIAYYDVEQKRPKEVIPIQYGKKEGDYFLYSPEGYMLISGQYKEDVKVGVWIEYFPNRRKKKETQYTKDPWAKDFEPYVIKEYTDKGKLIYDFKKDGAKKDSVSVGKQ